MINWKSILSLFNNKPTLLEWLKLVEKALKESVLTNVETNTVNGKTKFIFNFEDGTQIETDYIQTKGETGTTGAKIVKTELIGQDANGGNIYKQTFDNGTTANFTAPKGAKGDKGLTGEQGEKGATGSTGATGAQGVSVTGIEEVSDQIVGTQTLTTVRVHYSDGKTDEFPIYAENGQTPASTKKPFINGSILLKLNEKLTIKDNHVYIVRCYDSALNLKKFTINADKDIVGEVAFIITGTNAPSNSFAFANTGSIVLSDLVKTTSGVRTVTPSENCQIIYYEIDGTLNTFKGDKGEKGDKGDTGARGAQGDTGATPAVTASATVNNAVGTPSVEVVKSGTAEAPNFAFNFKNLKGEQGATGVKGDKGDPQTLYHKGIIMEATNLSAGDSFTSLKLYFDMYSFSSVIYGDSATEKIPEQIILSRGFIRTKVTAQSDDIDYQLAYVKLYHNGASTENKYTAEIVYWYNGAIKQVTLRTGSADIALKVTECTNSTSIDI